jgi:hypothetical protein
MLTTTTISTKATTSTIIATIIDVFDNTIWRPDTTLFLLAGLTPWVRHDLDVIKTMISVRDAHKSDRSKGVTTFVFWAILDFITIDIHDIDAAKAFADALRTANIADIKFV